MPRGRARTSRGVATIASACLCYTTASAPDDDDGEDLGDYAENRKRASERRRHMLSQSRKVRVELVLGIDPQTSLRALARKNENEEAS